MTMDQLRIGDVFDVTKVNQPVTIIGCGALGSAVALQLAKIGCTLVLRDFDVIEPHNIPNQLLYGINDVGRHKSEVLAEKLGALTGIPHRWSTRAVDEATNLDSRFVVCCVDSMAARQLVFDRLSDNDGLYFEGRMGAYDFSSYAVQRSDIEQMRSYAETIYPDDEGIVDRAACGTIMSIGATANLAASYMVWQFMKAVMGTQAPNFVTGSVRSEFTVKSYRWNFEGPNATVDRNAVFRRR